MTGQQMEDLVKYIKRLASLLGPQYAISKPGWVAVVGVCVLGMSACFPLLLVESASGSTSGMGGSTSGMGTGGGSSATGTGGGVGVTGTGAAGGCTQDADCNMSVKACYEAVCQGGACTEQLLPVGSPAPSQVYGDCRTRACDGQGTIIAKDDLFDIFDDANTCTIDYCAQGVTVHDPSGSGDACSTGFCDDFGACVPCYLSMNCGAGQVCQNQKKCVPPHCTNGMLDTGESAIDCGGPCAHCADGQPCITNADCGSSACDGGTSSCAPSTCTDGKKNGDEVAVDCGGATCVKRCDTDSLCKLHVDCASGVCIKAICRAPTCTDGTQNENETGVDCGGSCAACMP